MTEGQCANQGANQGANQCAKVKYIYIKDLTPSVPGCQ